MVNVDDMEEKGDFGRMVIKAIGQTGFLMYHWVCEMMLWLVNNSIIIVSCDDQDGWSGTQKTLIYSYPVLPMFPSPQSIHKKIILSQSKQYVN